MMNVADCRYLANQCLALAGRAETNEGRRKDLLEMAATWDRLAKELIKSRWRGEPGHTVS